MSLIRSLDDTAEARGGLLSIGNFDGVHRGHQQMLAHLTQAANDLNVPAVVLTFDPHPVKLLAPDRVPPTLSTVERKSELLHRYGVDHVIAAPTTHDLLRLEATTFFNQVVRDQLKATGMFEGPNFRFGRGRGGDVELLRKLCHDNDMTCAIHDAVCVESGDMISSSRVRNAISAGHLKDAVESLGHAYQLVGRVRRGDARGRELGFPTANLCEIATLIPGDGVYAGRALIDGKSFSAAINVGGNPTFGVDEIKIEVHLLDFQGDLYGRELAVDLIAEIRGVETFDSRDALIRQLRSDIEAARVLAANFNGS